MIDCCKLQICCLILISILTIAYYSSYRIRKKNIKKRDPIYISILIFGFLEIIFDGISAFTINNQNLVAPWINITAHLFFLITLDTEIFLLFIYIIKIADLYPKKKQWFLKMLIFIPYGLNILTVILFITQLDYIEGKKYNYSMGISAYTCFIMVGFYLLLTISILLCRLKYISRHKRMETLLFLLVFLGFTTYQVIVPESLLSSAAITVVILGIYLNEANPLYKEIADHNEEMVLGFATLVESRDGSTGGHIKRTTLYAEALAKELRRKGKYSSMLTADYVNNLKLSAPMHDVGKIAIPDAILQKPGRLTNEEFNIMKTHSEEGGKIIKQTFGNTSNKEYTKMAFDVASCHHEKWNGTGYPKGLKGEEIPLSARIMSVADVFDAISEKRCYKEAFPLDQCFEIIKNGSGNDFDPVIAETFLSMKDQIIEIRSQTSSIAL